MCFLCHHAKEEILLNEIELELKAEGIISIIISWPVATVHYNSSKSMGWINVRHLIKRRIEVAFEEKKLKKKKAF